MRSLWNYVPGASPDAPRRNALLLLFYVLLFLLLWGFLSGSRLWRLLLMAKPSDAFSIW